MSTVALLDRIPSLRLLDPAGRWVDRRLVYQDPAFLALERRTLWPSHWLPPCPSRTWPDPGPSSLSTSPVSPCWQSGTPSPFGSSRTSAVTGPCVSVPLRASTRRSLVPTTVGATPSTASSSWPHSGP